MFTAQCGSAALSGTVSFVAVIALLDQEWWVGIVVATVVASDALCALEQAVLAGAQRQLASAGLILFQRLAPFILVLLSDFFGIQRILGYGVGAAIAALPAVVLPIRHWHRPIGLSRLISTSRGYWLFNVIECLGMLDTVLVRAVGGPTAAGLYSIANRVVNPINIVTSAILSTITPAAAVAERREDQVSMLRRSTAISVICGAAFVAASPLIANVAILVLGEGYSGAERMIVGFIVAAALSGVSQTLVARYVIEGRSLMLAFSLAIGMALGLLSIVVAASVNWPLLLWVCPIFMQSAILTALAVNRRRRLRHVGPTSAAPGHL
jgi:O-antigen/teichoic acid export membrane protein